MNKILLLMSALLSWTVIAQDIPERFQDKTLVFTLDEGWFGSHVGNDYRRYYWFRFPQNVMVALNEGEAIKVPLRFPNSQVVNPASEVYGAEYNLGLIQPDGTILMDSGTSFMVNFIKGYLEYDFDMTYPLTGYTGSSSLHFNLNSREMYLYFKYSNQKLYIAVGANVPLTRYVGNGTFVTLYSHVSNYGKTVDALGDLFYDQYVNWNGKHQISESYVSILQYNPPLPKVVVKEMSFLNGINKFVDLKDFIEDPLGDDSNSGNDATVTVSAVQTHPSVSVLDGKFQINLGTSPITESGEAIYNMTVSNSYGSDTEQITLKLYTSSIKINGVNNGDTDPPVGIIGGEPGTSLEISALPDSNYDFSGWEGDVPVENANDNPLVLVFPETEQIEITPVFEEKPYIEMCDLTLDFDASKGTIYVDDNEYTTPPAEPLSFEKNTTLVIRVEAKEGYSFSNWVGNVSISQYESEEISILLSENKSFTAIFESVNNDDGENGETDSGDGNISLPYTGTSTVSTNSGYDRNISDIMNLLVDRLNTSATGTGRFTESSKEQQSSLYGNSKSKGGYSGHKNFFKSKTKDKKTVSENGDIPEGYNFKYKAYDKNDDETYYSNDEVEASRSFYNSVETFLKSILKGGKQ